MASNNTLDMFEELKTGAILQRGVACDPEALSGAEVFEWASAGGARAAGAGSTGELRVGGQADVVLVDVTGTAATPLHDAESFLYYAASGSDVTDVFVAGRHVVRNRRVTTMDEDQVREDVRVRVARIKAELLAAGDAPGIPARKS
ncbi:amidohydrolase family protein [Nakamurella antarctica]|uniref:amidohydrolase family protein n=1 Tax=Nakamurella antarctica TaxID=1902245 RepID=UPI0013DE4348|nr:amidohydrolase family protein [Nakamurella antarctica]